MPTSGPRTEIHDHNRKAWDRLVAKGNRFARPAEDDDCRNPLATVDALGWLGADIRGKSVLCLAAGGGRQSAIYAAAGARVTVVDISPAMLELDREVARQRRLEIRAVEASMDRLTMFSPQEFDIVIHPVATCYVPDILAVYREVARVIQPQGIYVSQHKTPTSLQTSIKPGAEGYVLRETYYRTEPLPPEIGTSLREEGCLEFLHRWEQLIGGLCRAGFVVEDLVEPMHAKPESARGEFGHRAQYVAPYVRIKARRVASVPGSGESSQASLWLPQ